MKVSIQPHILWQFIALVIVATLSIVAAIWFFIECRHGKSGSIPLLFLTIPCFIQGLYFLIFKSGFWKPCSTGLSYSSLLYNATRFSDCASCIFNPRPIFKYVVDIDNDHKKSHLTFTIRTCLSFGQIKSKMASSAKTMGVISCILILSIVLMAWLPVNAIRASEYQKITSPFDVQVLTTYSASSLEELPKPL